uniref:Putative Mechanosensitive ion channel n=1 Tax=uncultured marine microorganism HF4000_APKG8K5 TaxID=455555 RepID=B3TB40_9ZZZZ|nr:putative Mechanosensitive ion channel [uncultured marine microorganism HF4000_APKG8K5]
MEQWLENITAILSHDFISGISTTDWALAALILVAFLFLRKLFSTIVLGFAQRLAGKTRTDLDDNIIKALRDPLRFVFIILGILAAISILPLRPDLHVFMMHVINSLFTFLVFWTIYKLVEPLSFFFDHLSDAFGAALTEDMKYFSIRAFKTIFVFLGVMAILQEWGINIAAFLGGLGLAGMAVALAARDTISNLFGGLTIFMDKTFTKGDWIETPFVEGTVESIGLRATKIRSFAKALITVPNAKLANAPVVNWSRMTHRRIKMTIGLEYRTTAAQLEKIVEKIRAYLADHSDVAQDTTQMVHLVGFGDSSINLNLYYFTRTTEWLKWRDVVNANIIDFKKIVEAEGAAFAFPSRTVYLENATTAYLENASTTAIIG